MIMKMTVIVIVAALRLNQQISRSRAVAPPPPRAHFPDNRMVVVVVVVVVVVLTHSDAAPILFDALRWTGSPSPADDNCTHGVAWFHRMIKVRRDNSNEPKQRHAEIDTASRAHPSKRCFQQLHHSLPQSWNLRPRRSMSGLLVSSEQCYVHHFVHCSVK